MFKSIKEEAIKLQKNIDKVYEAGQKNMHEQFCDILRTTVTCDANYLSVDNVLPIEHYCSAKLVSLTQQPKNCYKVTTGTVYDMSNNIVDTITLTDHGNNSFTYSGYATGNNVLHTSLTVKGLTAGKIYTVSLRTDSGGWDFGWYGFSSDNIPSNDWSVRYNPSCTFTWGDGDTSYYAVDFMPGGRGIDTDGYDDSEQYTINRTFYFQIEEGSSMTDWEEYSTEGGKPLIEDLSAVKLVVLQNEYTESTVYTSDSNGNVTNILSVSPKMDLMPNTDAVNINEFTYCEVKK